MNNSLAKIKFLEIQLSKTVQSGRFVPLLGMIAPGPITPSKIQKIYRIGKKQILP